MEREREREYLSVERDNGSIPLGKSDEKEQSTAGSQKETELGDERVANKGGRSNKRARAVWIGAATQ
jgi:hypothetical protein